MHNDYNDYHNYDNYDSLYNNNLYNNENVQKCPTSPDR